MTTEPMKQGHLQPWTEPAVSVPVAALMQAIDALEHCRHRPHEHNPGPGFVITECEVIDRALASLRKAAGE